MDHLPQLALHLVQHAAYRLQGGLGAGGVGAAQALARRLGLADRLRFLGVQQAIEDIVGLADVFLLPSELESFGLSAVEAMARGVKKLARSDIGIAVSGIAGPGGGIPEKPVGTVFIGIDSGRGQTRSKKFLFHGTREEIKLVTSSHALRLIMQIFLNNV